MRRRLSGAVLRLLLAAFFLASGGGKLLAPPDPQTYRHGVLSELPSQLIASCVMVVASLEVAAAVVLVSGRFVRAGAVSLAILVGVLSVLVVLNADNDRFAADCGCFGAGVSVGVGGGLVSILTLLGRNALIGFGLLEIAATDQGSPSSGRHLVPAERRRPFVRMQWVGTVLLALACATTVRRAISEEQRTLAVERAFGRSRLLGLSTREFSATGPQGQEIRLRDLVGQPTTLIVFGPECPRCHGEVRKWRALEPVVGRVIYLGVGDEEAVERFVREYELPRDRTYWVEATAAFVTLGLRGVPEILRIDENGIVVWREFLATSGSTASWVGTLIRERPQLALELCAVVLGMTPRQMENVELVGTGRLDAGEPYIGVHVEGTPLWVVVSSVFLSGELEGTGRLDFVVLIDSCGRVVSAGALSPLWLLGRPIDVQLRGQLEGTAPTQPFFVAVPGLLAAIRARLEAVAADFVAARLVEGRGR